MQMALKDRVKSLIVETLMLQMTPTELTDDQKLFGPGSLGLDSVDALQLVVMLDKNFGLKIPDAAAAREILGSVTSMITAVEQHELQRAKAP
jgi:acyl carrier protein